MGPTTSPGRKYKFDPLDAVRGDQDNQDKNEIPGNNENSRRGQSVYKKGDLEPAISSSHKLSNKTSRHFLHKIGRMLSKEATQEKKSRSIQSPYLRTAREKCEQYCVGVENQLNHSDSSGHNKEFESRSESRLTKDSLEIGFSASQMGKCHPRRQCHRRRKLSDSRDKTTKKLDVVIDVLLDILCCICF